MLTRYWSPDGPDRRHLGLRPVEDLERGQPRDHVEEVPGQDPEGVPLTVDPGLGVPADQDHEHRDDRHRQRDDHRSQGVLGDDDPGGDQRDHDGQDQLRQVAGEVGVQGAGPAGHQVRQLAHPAPAQERRPQAQRPIDHLHPQLRGGAGGRPVPDCLGRPRQHRPAHRDRDQGDEGARELGPGPPPPGRHAVTAEAMRNACATRSSADAVPIATEASRNPRVACACWSRRGSRGFTGQFSPTRGGAFGPAACARLARSRGA